MGRNCTPRQDKTDPLRLAALQCSAMVKAFRATSRAAMLEQMKADPEVAPYIDIIRALPLASALQKRGRLRHKSCHACGKFVANHSPEELDICSRRGRPRKR